MHDEQILFFGATLGTFAICLAVVLGVSGYLYNMHPIFATLNEALANMDAKFLVTVALGAILSIALLYLFMTPLNPDEWRSFVLAEKTQISKTTALYVGASCSLSHRYRFALEHNAQLGLPIGQHISVRALISGRQIMRSYTPVSRPDAKGHFDLLVKSYEKGNISRIFAQLRVGDSLEMKGPKGRFLYKRNMVPRIGMIAGGTGITPCLQVLKSALSDTADKTRFDLLYANVTEDEILLRDEVEALAATHPTRLSVYYFLNVPPAGWTQGTGFITKEAISERLPGPDKSRILMCGPPPMMEAMKKHLAALQFQVPGVISKMEDAKYK